MNFLRPAFLSLLCALLASSLTASDVERLLSEGRLGEAEQTLRQQIAIAEDWTHHDLLGIVLSRQRRVEEADAAFQRALELAPPSSQSVPRQHLARHYLLSGRQEAALGELRAAAQSSELERELASTLAQLEARAGRLDAAAVQWNSLAGRFNSVRALLSLAELHMRRQEPKAAFEILQRALDLAPNSEDVLATYARTALATRLPVPAILALEPLTRMHPSVAEYAHLLGVSRMQAGDLLGALEILERATQLEPDRALSWLALALVFNKQKRFEEAEASSLQCLSLDPTNIEALAARAEAVEGLGRLDEALELAERVLTQSASHATANLALGMVLMKRQNFDEARQALEKSIATSPSAKAHYQLSLALARLGDGEGSQKQLRLYREAQKSVETSLLELRDRRLPIDEDRSTSRPEETRH